jgi:hypothetical protein
MKDGPPLAEAGGAGSRDCERVQLMEAARRSHT